VAEHFGDKIVGLRNI